METSFQNNSIFFVDVEKIKPNPFQPRIEFDDAQLESLSESIRMYGVLQPLVVTRKEVFTEEGGMTAQYELIAGERRLRASKLAGLKEVPVVIRSEEQTDQEKLELAIIENLQREDLNPVDRAKAFRLLADDFNLKHAEIGKRVGKSREYVSNSLRLLALPEDMLMALTAKKISEGHARSLLMLGDRPEEQMTLFKEIMLKGLTVRHAEKIARRVAYDKVRKKKRAIDPHVVEVEEEMSEALGTRVHIERKAVGGKIEIDFFSEDDLSKILEVLKQHEDDLATEEKDPQAKMNSFIEQSGGLEAATGMVFEKQEAEAQAQETSVQEEVQKEIQEEVQEQVEPEAEEHFSYSEIMSRSEEAPTEVEKEEVLQKTSQEPVFLAQEPSVTTEPQVQATQEAQPITEQIVVEPTIQTSQVTPQEDGSMLEDEGIEILTDTTPVTDEKVVETSTSQEAQQGHDAPTQAPQEYTIQQEGISENKIDPESVQVQSILQNAQQPLPVGDSVQNMAESHAEEHSKELYYNLPPEAQKTKLDAPTEVATPHYGNADDNDEHLYRV